MLRVSRHPREHHGEFAYVVVAAENYDSWDISHHKSLKGALQACIAYKYADWETCRVPGYNMDITCDYYINEVPLYD
ncbi:hypothetical protein PMW_83 [Pseudomonas phage phiPMW]|uniref:Uncharacterized protein n=1 Tax=Pseudomonas phage phiPMW TaxID=1815582 RepID=A0A1S5R1F4_9CAUD|nr:hypothetical protein FDG97_gp083 [Pseudomonas phage phiPMW]ANA49208.1 hypothetical protein PMW_83 [Pseudomonas phage phiPMW]